MPTVISDASVLIGLGATGQIELLRGFYAQVLVPPAVWAEVTSAGTRPGAAEAHAAKNQGWLQFQLLQQHRFRVGRTLYEAVLRQAGEAL